MWEGSDGQIQRRVFTRNIPDGHHHIKFLPIIPFCGGDLAYIATAQGRKDFCSSWCLWCNEKHGAWQQNEMCGLRKYSKEFHRTCVNAYLQDPTPLEKRNHRNSFRDKEPLFPDLPDNNFVLPPLHIMLGLGNALYNAIILFNKDSNALKIKRENTGTSIIRWSRSLQSTVCIKMQPVAKVVDWLVIIYSVCFAIGMISKLP
mmetsp:Transcript_25036/g.41858  ORF Transcript_25036/g.41858 Transcript_25036/m.41858 type:complete len:202 (-) Transcript_25036:191-796(-)